MPGRRGIRRLTAIQGCSALRMGGAEPTRILAAERPARGLLTAERSAMNFPDTSGRHRSAISPRW